MKRLLSRRKDSEGKGVQPKSITQTEEIPEKGQEGLDNLGQGSFLDRLHGYWIEIWVHKFHLILEVSVNPQW